MPVAQKSKNLNNLLLNKPVFILSSLLSLLLIVGTIHYPQQAELILKQIFVWTVTYFDWYYMLVIVVYVVFCILIACSRYGNIKLGQEQDKSEFSYLTWASMLFAAGIGIDLLFFAVFEPLAQYINPIEGSALTQTAAKKAIEITFFHWGIHGWAIYALVGMTLAYFAYRKKQALALRSALVPVFGHKLTNGWLGHLIDTFGVVCTLLGVTTSLGIGVLQLNAGISHVFGISTSTLSQAGIIILIVGIAALSAMSGVKKGIKRLSQINMIAASIILLIVLLLGPTLFLFNALILNIGDYFQNIIANSFNTLAYMRGDANQWKGTWTIFFWAWWIAWAPFVGLFIARISRGRTIREFVLGVMFIPLGFIFAWFSIFGNTAIDLYNNGQSSLNTIATTQPEMGLFILLEQFPFGIILSGLAVIIGMIFFITSADSATLVLSNLCSKNLKNDQDAPIKLRLYWAICLGLVTLGVLLAGGFESLQSISVAAGLPFSIVILIYMFALVKSLRTEVIYETTNYHAQNANWKARLSNLVEKQRKEKIFENFAPIVHSAINEVATELKAKNIQLLAINKPTESILQIFDNETNFFLYQIQITEYLKPAKFLNSNSSKEKKITQIQVNLLYQSYYIEYENYHKEYIILDILNRYEDYLKQKNND